MNTSDVLDRLSAVTPDLPIERTTRIADLPAVHRLILARWLSGLFEQPTDLDVVRQFATVGDAGRWVERSVAAGEPLRSAAPTMVPRVRLRPIFDQDIEPLYRASFDPDGASRWRFRGQTIGAEEFVATLHDGVRAQYVVEMVEERRALGLVVAYDHNQPGLHAKVAFLRFGDHGEGDAGAMIEGLALLAGHLFSSFPYRKLFAELPAYNLGLDVPGLLEHEAVLRDYYFHGGEPVDLHVLSLTRERWNEFSAATGW